MHIYDEIAHYYDAEVATFADDIPFYREMVRRTGGPILEPMCGSGRVLLALLEKNTARARDEDEGGDEEDEEGVIPAITGVDSSAVMLEIANQHLASITRKQQCTFPVTLVHADIRTVALPENHFALAFIALNSFMHLTTIPDQLAALATIRRALRPHGVFILDLFNPDAHALSQENNRLIVERTFRLPGCEVIKFAASESDMAAQLNYMTSFYDTIDASGHWQRKVVRYPLRWFYRYELEHLLARAGFLVESVYGSYHLDPYESSSDRLIVVATRDGS